MCAAHRKTQLAKIRTRLEHELPCTVVSTQLIEAGVDVDFPVVFRAMTGLDSIAQAAGRCNREGNLKTGIVYVFTPKEVKLRGMLKQVAQSGAEAISLFPSDPLSLPAIEHYFQLHYWQNKDAWDKHQVMDCFADPSEMTFQFRTAAERFRLIEDRTKNLFIPLGDEGHELEKKIRMPKFNEEPGFRKSVLRRIQRFLVPVYEDVFRQLLSSTEIEPLNENLAILVNQSMYSDQIGFDSSLSGHVEIQQMVI
jgi:CRISPR-associated endonuclease/helicase Cas3